MTEEGCIRLKCLDLRGSDGVHAGRRKIDQKTA